MSLFHALTNRVDEGLDVVDVGSAGASTLAASTAVDTKKRSVRREVVTEGDTGLAIDVCRDR
jgi:hypothetical protein